MSRFQPWTTVGLLALALTPGAARADVVTEWNSLYLQALRATGGPPCPIARNGAILHLAIYDAINSIDRTHEPYFMFEDVSPTASKEAAAAMAAHRVLSQLYGVNNPGLQLAFNKTLDAQLAAIPDGQAKTDGMNLGMSCANGMMALREDDGSTSVVDYVPGPNPGDWVPTYPDFTMPPASPQWPGVTPFTMVSGSQFRPVGPAGYTTMTALLASPEYAAVFNEVKDLGAIDSTTRTAEQTFIARFWANDRNGTYKPPGHLNYIARIVAAQQGLTLEENARLLALINLAMADAGVVAWDAKYSTDIDLWRPITGIRQADLDGNAATDADPLWEPLSNDPQVNGFTPPFPAWVSGHATFGATHAAVMKGFFRNDNIAFTIGSDDTPGQYRSFTSFTQAALENGRSRVYLGVHWQLDADDAFVAGQALGNFVVANYLRRIGDTNGDCVVDVNDLLVLIGAWGPCPAANVATCPADVAPPGGNGMVDVNDLLALIGAWGDCP